MWWWTGIVDGSAVGKAFEAATNYDLATLTYQGNSWQERLSSGGMALAQLAASRVGAKIGKWGAHKLNILPCFPAGTPIRTLHSSVAIEDLKVGDIVLSRDEFDSGAAVAGRRVEAVFVRRAVVMSIGVGGRIIETTEEHPFWVVGKGWTAANAMRVGDRVLTATGEPLRIESVGEARREATVYNFRVEEWHTYFVGDPNTWGFDVWVHNNHTAASEIDKSWKLKIDGKAQKTGTPGHQFRTYREAIAEAKKPDVQSVHLDHGYNRGLDLDPKTIKSNRRPDVLSLYEDKSVVRIEVQSKTDIPSVLRSRNAALDAQLRAQGFVPRPPRVVRPTTSP